MAAFKQNLAIDQGATYRKLFTWKVGTPKLPTDLTGCTARMHVRSELEATTTLLVLTTENGRIALGGTAGTIILSITAADTTLLNWATAVYDLEVVFADTSVRRLLYGKVTVSPEVTR